MRIRIAITSVVCAASALALASLMTTWSTNGSGTVRNSAGRQGWFRVEAAKRVHNRVDGAIAPGLLIVIEDEENTGDGNRIVAAIVRARRPSAATAGHHY